MRTIAHLVKTVFLNILLLPRAGAEEFSGNYDQQDSEALLRRLRLRTVEREKATNAFTSEEDTTWLGAHQHVGRDYEDATVPIHGKKGKDHGKKGKDHGKKRGSGCDNAGDCSSAQTVLKPKPSPSPTYPTGPTKSVPLPTCPSKPNPTPTIRPSLPNTAPVSALVPGGPTPSIDRPPVPTQDPTPEPTTAPTPAPTPEPTVAQASTPTPVPTTAPTQSPTPGPIPASTPTPVTTPTPTPRTQAPTHVPTTVTQSPTPGPTPAPTPTPVTTPTPTPTPVTTTAPTPAPTPVPTLAKTTTPTPVPTTAQTQSPTPGPTPAPTPTPVTTPTPAPTPVTTRAPTQAPTPVPTLASTATTTSTDGTILCGNALSVSVGNNSNSQGRWGDLAESISLSNAVDCLQPTDTETHIAQSTHVWWVPGPLELIFAFVNGERTVTDVYFWNYYEHYYDVDTIEFTFETSALSGNEVIFQTIVNPRDGQNPEGRNANPIVSERFAMPPGGVRASQVRAIFSAFAPLVHLDFMNIIFVVAA